MVKTPCFQCRGGGGGLVNQSCLTLCDPMHCSPPGFSVHGILQTRILEWVAISSSRESSRPRNQTLVSSIAGRFFTSEPPEKSSHMLSLFSHQLRELYTIIKFYWWGKWSSKRLWLVQGQTHNKEYSCNAGDLSLIPGLGRIPGGGNGNPLQDSCLENPADRGGWRATVHGVPKSQMWLSD